MWRSILVVLLLPSLLRAQQQALVHQENPSSPHTFRPSYKTLTQREAIRRGTSEKSALSFMLGNDGLVALVSPRDRAANVTPLKLEFADSEGIAVSDFVLPPDTKLHTAPLGEHLRLLWPNGAIRFKVTAAHNASLGVHVLKGKLTYQLVGRKGPLPPTEMEVALPLIIVQHDAVVKSSQLYKEKFARDEPLWFWFLMPVLIPLVLLMMVVCAVRGEDCSC